MKTKFYNIKLLLCVCIALLSINTIRAEIGCVSFKNINSGANALETTIGKNTMTYEFWTYFENNVGVLGGNIASGKGFLLAFDGWFKFQMNEDVSVWADPTSWKGKWTHIACVVDGKELIVYANGIKVASVAWTNGYNLAADGNNLWIGCASWGNACVAKIADVRLWNVARTPQEILDNYKKTIDPASPGLVANYTFSEATGDNTANRVSGGNTAWFKGAINTSYDWDKAEIDGYASSEISYLSSPACIRWQDELRFTGLQKGDNISIYDINGCMIVSAVAMNETEYISTKELNGGCYIVKIMNKTSHLEYKFVK